LQEDEIQKAIFVGNYEGAVDTCLKTGRLADALLIANIGGAELFKKTMHRYMRRNPRPYMAVSCGSCCGCAGPLSLLCWTAHGAVMICA
jgi:Ni,Fe-hydrogenase III small subunit